jgi:alcohol dehydrogenase class IV
MQRFAFVHSTRRILCGAGVLGELGRLAEQRSAPAAILDPFFDTAAMRDRLAALLGPALRCHAVPAQEPDAAVVEACRAFLAAAPFDLLLVLGGGSAMDAAKVARMLVANPGDLRALAGPMGVPMAPHPSLFIAAPSTAGTGSEVSESAVISAAGESYKLIFRAPEMTPAVALLDPELCTSAPAAVTAASGYDALTHAVEAYTARTANPFTDPIAIAAVETLVSALPRAFAAPDDLAARLDCLVASAQAAIAFNSANLGLAHAISGALGALHHVGHGLGNALALPWTMAFNGPALGAKGARLAALLGAPDAATGLARLRERLGLDVGLDAVLPAGADFDAIAAAAARSGQVRVNPRSATVAELRAIIERMRHPIGGAPVGQPVVPAA